MPSFQESGLDTNILLCWLSPMARPAVWIFLSPNTHQPAPGTGHPKDRHPEALLTWKCVPSCFFTSSHVLCQACAFPVAPGTAPVLLDGCRVRGRAAAPQFLHGQVSPGPTLKPDISAAAGAASPFPTSSLSLSPPQAGCQSSANMHRQVSVASPVCAPPGM